MTDLPATVGVLGGGRMGAGIAQVALVAGSRVVLIEASVSLAAAAGDRVMAGLTTAKDKGHLDADPRGVLDGLSVAADPAALGGCGLVVEAVPEDADLKRRVLSRAAATLAEDAILATNTSSIAIADLAGAVPDPSRFLGLHFFNPVPASALVEVVAGDATADAVVERAQGWVRALGKEPVVVRDRPGFATSRLGVLLGLEAIRMVEEGVAEPAAIDRAIVLGYRHPMGPLRLGDLVGLDVRLDIATYLQSRLGDRFAPPRLLRDKVARGELGRKSGRGFYDWE